MAPPLIQLKDIALTFGGTPLLGGVESRAFELLEIFARVHQCERVEIDRLRRHELGFAKRTFRDDQILEQRILGNRKWMTGRQRDLIPRMVGAFH